MRKLRMGMVGGGQGAFIGWVHRFAAALDQQIEMTAGCFSRDRENTKYLLPKDVDLGERLNSINSFLEVDLPPYGPYELGGRFQLKKTGYYLSDLNVRVNQSHMTGKMSLETGVRPPRLDIDLTTRTLQIDDFDGDSYTSRDGDMSKNWVTAA